MSQHMSRIVVSVLFSTLATASFADQGGQTPIQQTVVQWNQDYYNTTSQDGFGQNIASKSGNKPEPVATSTTNSQTFKSFGDFLHYLRSGN